MKKLIKKGEIKVASRRATGRREQETGNRQQAISHSREQATGNNLQPISNSHRAISQLKDRSRDPRSKLATGNLQWDKNQLTNHSNSDQTSQRETSSNQRVRNKEGPEEARATREVRRKIKRGF